ncbi:D-aminoacylase [[Actinomadura] parvosata subsp. kistnae]|uniref:Uncharacterized protein n=1 Tax=[Actinomadura] parvosata subsp. kistnae TaxID=1909395 RepID=A0A1V0AE84_9ACTN|nr:hypothetical protein [Nonomuraea sp. ATCC 55076]AQZ68541.1 hypothetical protein BKM31_50035 [Nonomuraea sp. ATCC 55076]SPL92996.1 D-aminoacylase [Actinomadura parvosata subsp. kistnae]
MPGTFTHLARPQNGFGYALLFNQREESGPLDFEGIDDDMNKVDDMNKGTVSSWPTTDLTSQYF